MFFLLVDKVLWLRPFLFKGRSLHMSWCRVEVVCLKEGASDMEV